MKLLKRLNPLFILFGALLLPNFVFSRYCSYNQYGNYHCTNDDGSYEYWNNTTNGNPYSGLPYYHSNGGGSYSYYVEYTEPTYVQELTPNEKCDRKYPGTHYRSSDGWCACFLDPKGISTWDSALGRCPTEKELNQRCNKKYHGTIYRRSDGWCACPGDHKKGTSSWTEEKGCYIDFYGTEKKETKSKTQNVKTEEKSSWNFFWEVFKVELGIVVIVSFMGGGGIIVVWALTGLPILLCSVSVGLGIMDEDSIWAMGLFTVIWFWAWVLFWTKFVDGFSSVRKKCKQ